MMNSVAKTRNFVLKTRNFVSKTMDFVSKMMDFVSKMMDFVSKMMDFAAGRSSLVPTWSGLFSCVFAFMVPVNLQEFTVLKTALPRAAPLPFFVFRQIEMLVIGSWYPIMNFVFKMMDFVLNLMDFVLNLMDFGRFVHEVYCESAVMQGMLSERDVIGFWGDCTYAGEYV